ncbi:hypothetical protein [uncultured Sunxiuqinia sp.]|uniref:hypothetical protein n=1 Tax=uncultured Sunxiuqinia sp. TaxID=1573825 RepID=UPI00262A95D5|nr:hypothetical protein [uncultured Sunxiuqinia sp.]
MKRKAFLLTAILLVAISGCVIVSFYPLYTEDDLFPNDLLLGEWMDSDSAVWAFEFNYNGEHVPENLDSTAYILRIKDEGEEGFSKESFLVHLIKLEDHYFLNFKLDDYFGKDPDFFDMHLVSVNSFARLKLTDKGAQINWFDLEWLEDLIEQDPSSIAHENNGDRILLTAKTPELQRFVLKYANSGAAFENSLSATLTRIEK